jgi:hypothetical protein
MQDITLPEVAALQQRARFFKDGEADKVEISAIGSKDTFIKKVGPDEMAKFKPEWDAYCDGKPMTRRPGTALTDIAGVDQVKADSYIARNIHNAEELAVLTDGQCQAVGHGTLTDRKHAQEMLIERKMKREIEQRDAVGRAAASVGVAPAQPSNNEQIAELGTKIDGVLNGINALVLLMSEQTKKAGKKVKTNAEG